MSGNYGAQSAKALRAEIRTYTVGDLRRREIQAELDLRQAEANARYLFWSVIMATLAAGGSMIAAIASLIALHYAK